MANKNTAEKKVLFVCTGNTCRSPMAEYCLKWLSRGEIPAVSAGLYAFDGEAMSENSLSALAGKGIDGSSFRSRSVTFDLVDSAALILTMTASHRAELLIRFPEAAEKCHTLLEISGGGDVPDPFGRTPEVYRQTLEVICRNVEKWLETFNNF